MRRYVYGPSFSKRDEFGASNGAGAGNADVEGKLVPDSDDDDVAGLTNVDAEEVLVFVKVVSIDV